MNYPEEFSREARARIVAAKTRADQQLILTRSGSEPVTTNSGRLAFVHVQSNWMAAVLGAFAHEACEIARSNIWSVDHVSELVQAYHTELAQIVKAKCDEVKHRSGGQIAGDWVDSTYAEILGWVELSQEWRQYQTELLTVADQQIKAAQIASENSKPSAAIRQRKEPQPELLQNRVTVSRTEAANVLGVTVRTIDRLVEDNRLHPTGDWGRKRFAAQELLDFMARKKKGRPRQK